MLIQPWKEFLSSVLKSKEMTSLKSFLSDEYKKETIYPKYEDIFNALNFTVPNNVKVVIVGQDPYHGPNQAHGLSFSVQRKAPTPPSLRNIYTELMSDLGVERPKHGCLTYLSRQGVLLLNRVLTVREGMPNSHAKKGWEYFTQAIIEKLSHEKENIVFILWGKSAQSLHSFVDTSKHLVIESAHPSPLSAYSGFFGSAPFSKANQYLLSKDRTPIDWDIAKQDVSEEDRC